MISAAQIGTPSACLVNWKDATVGASRGRDDILAHSKMPRGRTCWPP
jgi:hypothetical protein